jgi:integrase
MKFQLPYVVSDPDRHGNPRLYVRRHGRKVRIRQEPGTEGFLQAYHEALRALEPQGSPPPHEIKRARAGSLGWLAARYLASTEFGGLDPTSRRRRRAIIEECLREPLRPGAKEIMRDCPVAALTAAHVKMLRDRKAAKPAAANNRRKWLSAMFAWAVEDGLMHINPTRDVRRIRYVTTGFHTWTVDEALRFEAHHPVGTKPRLAFALMLYLGVRRSDAARIGPKHVKGDLQAVAAHQAGVTASIRFVPRKTRKKKSEPSEKPILPVLAEVLVASKVGEFTFLITKDGKPYTDAGLGNAMRDWCDEAGLPECTAHGLRKVGAALAAESGATDRELMALFDWSSQQQANTYTAAASRKRLAGRAAKLITLHGHSENE